MDALVEAAREGLDRVQPEDLAVEVAKGRLSSTSIRSSTVNEMAVLGTRS